MSVRDDQRLIRDDIAVIPNGSVRDDTLGSPTTQDDVLVCRDPETSSGRQLRCLLWTMYEAVGSGRRYVGSGRHCCYTEVVYSGHRHFNPRKALLFAKLYVHS
jgi:hypothetical protein